MLESPTDIQGQITQRLEADGLSPQCGEGEKLLYLWRLYQQIETDLKKARENEEKLKEAQTEEMREVENYVEHIRHLSDEREALIQELETENEQLKSDLEQARSELVGEAQQETAEMLTQQGLAEIAEASPSEQVAYLLVERARLLDDLESAQTPTPINQSAASGGRDSQELKEILEQERKDFEQELSSQRESASLMKEQLRKEHEEEISALMDENGKLEEELQEAKKKAGQLEQQIERLNREQNEEQEILEEERADVERERDQALKKAEALQGQLAQLEKERQLLQQQVAQLEKERDELESDKDSLERERRDSWKDSSRETISTPTTPVNLRPSSPSVPRSPNDVAIRKVIEEKTKIEGEMIHLRTQIRTLRGEREAAEEEMKKAKGESEKLHVQIQQLQLKNKNLRQELEEVETTMEEAETTAEEATKLKDEMSEKYETLNAEVKTLRAESQRSTTLQDIVDILSNEKQQLNSTLDNVRKEMEKVLGERDELSSQNLQLSQTEQQLAGQMASLKEELTALERERDELFVERDDLMTSQNAQDSLLSSLKVELGTAQNSYDKLSNTSDQLEKENKELHNKLERALADVENLKHTSQELAKQELIVSHQKEQLASVNKQVSELQSQLEWARHTEQSLLDSQHTTQRSHSESEKRMTMEIDELRVKLQHALTELQVLKSAHEEQLTEKSSLTEQLSLTESRLHESLQLKSSLEQEARTKSELEHKVRELEIRLVDKTRLADGFEDERKQRVELERKVADLNRDHAEEVTKVRGEVVVEKQLQCELEAKVQDLEQALDEVRVDNDTLQDSMKTKVQSLEARMGQLQDDLFSAQDEVQAFQQKYQQAVTEAEVAKAEMLKQHVQALEEASATESASIQELESSLELTSKKLQDCLNDLNSANTKISVLEEECANSKAELKKAQTELKSVGFQNEVSSQRYQDMENSVKLLNRDLKESQGALLTAKSQLQDKQSLLESVKQEMESLNRELEYLRETSQTDSEAKTHYLEKMKMMESKVRQLEQDNSNLAKKLADCLVQCEQLKEKLDKEKFRNTDSHHQSARYVEQLEADLNAANKHIRMLRDELQEHQSSVFKLEASNLGQSAKYESMVMRLEAEVKEVRQQLRRESDSMAEKLAVAMAECREAQNQLREKEQLITDLRREASRAQTSVDRLQAQLLSESKTRSDVENRNTTLEHEMTKVWSQVRMLMERNASLESGKKSAEEDLDRKTSSLRQLETTLSQKESSLQSSLRESQSRVDSAEKHVRELEQELSLMVAKATTAEQKLQQAELSQSELAEKSQQLASVRNQLEGERLQRTLLDQTVAELKHQVSLLKQRESKVATENKELQHSVLDLESRLTDMQERSDNSYQVQHQMSESSRQSLMDQITRLQQEVKSLQYELLTTSERRDIDLQRYEERKQRTKAKLMKAREFYSVERTKYMEHMRHMDDDLRLTRAALHKELEWKDKMDSNYKHLLDEKRELITQLTEQEEVMRDKSRGLSMLQVRVSYLEDENRHLQQRADSLAAQKQTLDKLVKDFQHNRDREVASQVQGQDGSPALIFTSGSLATATSDLGNSGDVAWEQDQAEDGSLVFRHGSTFHPVAGQHAARNMPGFRVADQGDFDLYPREFKGHNRQDSDDVIRLYRDKLEEAGDGGESCDEFEA